MTDLNKYDEIQSISAELSGYRKGSLTVFIDLEKGYLTWRESTRWCNDFTRTITSEQIQAIRSDIEACRLLNWHSMRLPPIAEGNTDIPQQSRLVWHVRINLNGKSWLREGVNRLPTQWEAFCAAIERISRTSFRL